MKYRIIGAVACICILLVSVLNYPVLLTGRMESRRYHQHREATPKAVCAVHAEKEFCTHLPLIVIDTGGAEIPGRGLVDEEDRHMGFTTTAEGADRITAQMRVMDSAEENNHPTDAPAVESNVVIHVRGNSSRYFEKAGYRLELVDENGDNNPKSLMGMDAHHEWALHGPYLDKSLMRNYMWYNIAGECMEYAPNVRFCELMLNGEYQGIYVLTELIGSGRDGARLNMEVDARDNTYTGYLLRLDRQDGSEYDRLNSLTTYSYRNEMELKLEVEFPGEKKLTPEIKEAIKTDFSAFEKGLYSYDYDSRKYGYRAQVDVDSFVNYLILNEFTYAGREGYTSYTGKYLTTTDKATPFEVLLARVGDKVLGYESSRYKTQKLIAFSNWPTTDPFQYPDEIKRLYMKCATVDMEHICTTERVISGQFASYHVYPYYPDYLNWTEDWSGLGLEDHEIFRDEDSRMNTYRAYLTGLVAHHTMPVVISEFGVSTGRGMAHRDLNTGRNQGNMTEQEQGMALATCYEDIKAAGCAGSVVFAWQDEWFKRTWNTMHAVNLTRTPYWSDIQTNEQYFGLLAFDPGQEQTVCTLDGDPTEWTEMDVIGQNEGMTLSAKYDERYLYLMVRKEGWNPEGETLYLPIDTTPKTGTSYCQNFGLKFDRGVDFLVVLDGRENSRVMVQEPYEVLRSTYSQNVWGYDTYLRDNLPDPHAPGFTNIDMILEIFNEGEVMTEAIIAKYGGATFETGRLRYGCGDPASAAYDSLADFMTREGCIELRLPWQLLNFADPSKMQILDDYYNGNYGIEHINIDEMYLGVMMAEQESRCELSPLTLTGWGNRVTYHERLKASYYMMQELWNG